MKKLIVPLLLATTVFAAGCAEEKPAEDTLTPSTTSTPVSDPMASTGGGTDAGSTAAPAGAESGSSAPAADGASSGSAGGPAKVAEKDYKTTDTGLKYAILKPGKGAEAKDGQTVAVHYTGWLKDGTKFDSSLDRNEPIRFPLGARQVVQGWDQGIKGMKIGEKRQLVIPPKLGYGEEGRPPVIPANSTLVFDVELVDAK